MSNNHVYLLGDEKYAFICGVNSCPINGKTLPFFGVADNSKIVEALGLDNETRMFEEQEDIDKMVNLYRESGSLIFFQHMGAARTVMRHLAMTFSVLADQGWTGEDTPTVN
jgi:hypothetical protein